MDTAILPLAITMMAGPQILSAVIFATSDKPYQTSSFFVAGVATGTTVGLIIAMALAGVFGDQLGGGEPSSTAQYVQIGLVGLLILASLGTYRKRDSIEPPKWLGALQKAAPPRAFLVGAALVMFFPSDVAVLLTSGVHLQANGHGLSAAVPFIALTTLIAALPLIALLLFRKRAVTAVPAFRRWMNQNTWLVNIIVYLIFIYLILG